MRRGTGTHRGRSKDTVMSLGVVLIVDDQEVIRQTVGTALVKAGYDVLQAARCHPIAAERRQWRKRFLEVVRVTVRLHGLRRAQR